MKKDFAEHANIWKKSEIYQVIGEDPGQLEGVAFVKDNWLAPKD